MFERTAQEGSYTITVEGEEIVATPNHPFWVEGKGWLRADELSIDDFFIDEEGNLLDITAIEIDQTPLVVYNFEVEDYHTYFVGYSNLLTHNLNCGSLLTYNKVDKSWTSKEGLLYTKDDNKFGNRVKHVLAHGKPDSTKPNHTMFNVSNKEILPLIDEAWLLKKTNNISHNPLPNNGSRINLQYDIDMGRIVGTNNEQKIRIVIKKGTESEIITAFPIQ